MLSHSFKEETNCILLNIFCYDALFSSVRCFVEGVNLKSLRPYNKHISYPVANGTPMISSLIKWDHSQSWDVPKLEEFSTSGL